MKKMMAILMALAVCGTAAFAVYAEETDDVEDAVAITTEEEDIFDEDDFSFDEEEDTVDEETPETTSSINVDALLDDEKATALVNDLKNALANNGDIGAVYSKVVEYVGDLTAAGSGRDALDKFLEDSGVNTEVLNEAISNSVIANAALDLYYKPEEETTEEPTDEEPVEEDEVYIPDTGYKF